ncbi:MAG: IS66 family insertion sequence element accessory protein TnpB [Rhodobacter sp.]|nr:IS66 family insertion sequence element accessory protein TnpB [Rhodobacter sp.]
MWPGALASARGSFIRGARRCCCGLRHAVASKHWPRRISPRCSYRRRGMDGLAALVQQAFGQDPLCGAVYLFRGKRGRLIKCVWHDGQGLCLFAKRLERGHFLWPVTNTGTVVLSVAQASMLLEGIDWRTPQRTWRPSAI